MEFAKIIEVLYNHKCVKLADLVNLLILSSCSFVERSQLRRFGHSSKSASGKTHL